MKMIEQTKEFLQEVKAEYRRVSFPTRRETMGATLVVIVFVVIISIFLALTDAVLARFVSQVLGQG